MNSYPIPEQSTVKQFIQRWAESRGHERAVYQQFFVELCDLLGVERPNPSVEDSPDYKFDKAVLITHRDGKENTGFVDFYKRGHFIIEAKQGSNVGDVALGVARRGTTAWDNAMRAAYGQAINYANHLPEGKPPFVLTCDIGHVFEVWDCFSGSYRGYAARRTIKFSELIEPQVLGYLIKIFVDPYDLDPSRHAAKVTQEVATHLAELARTLESAGHEPGLAAEFLMRCIFTMFAEDVGLIPNNLFTDTIRDKWISNPHLFPSQIVQLWRAMNEGLPFGFEERLLRFNGGLFAFQDALPLDGGQLEMLLEAAKCDWSAVEPAIFGTLVERALDPRERHSLGAHFTPREYIERLIKPAVIEPLQREWELVQAQVRQVLSKRDGEPTPADNRQAIKLLKDFHTQLVNIKVLDPACGSGNFLYVCLDLFKQLEAEVLRELSDLGESYILEMESVTVGPNQFFGIEINPRARAIADLVLWIGYLQWQCGISSDIKEHVPEPVLREYRNIEGRDAVLAHDGMVLRRGDDGKPVTVWDMHTYTTHPVTGKQVPDDDARVPIMDPVNPRQAEWPEADYILSNPPFVGNFKMREALGDGYAEALRKAYPQVNNSADLVMYWWDKAASLVREGKVKGFGLITTNSITQTFNRRTVESHVNAKKNPLFINWAIPDHPWVEGGALVRISMTIGAGTKAPRFILGKIASQSANDTEVAVEYSQVQRINPDLSQGVDITGVTSLKANDGISCPGVKLHGAGFIVTQEEAKHLGLGTVPGLENHIRHYRNGNDINRKPRNVMVIDLFGLTIEEVRNRYPAVYQKVLETVKPGREQNKRAAYRNYWWIFGEPRKSFRPALQQLKRFIVTTETSKHRFFMFLNGVILPDNMLVNIALDDAYYLGVLSSRYHVVFAMTSGGTLGTGSRYNKTRCFDPFPFPDATETQKNRIRELAEALDAHRKRVQEEHPDVTMTGMYNALERLREIEREEGVPLTTKERDFHGRALIGVLKSYHEDIDHAVADAYGWPVDLTDEEILYRLVELNAVRSKEEAEGKIRWLRPAFQCPESLIPQPSQQPLLGIEKESTPIGDISVAKSIIPWPFSVPEQLRTIRDLLTEQNRTWSVNEVARLFKRARRAAIQQHLESLETLGVLVSHNEGDEKRWGVSHIPD